MVCMLCRANAIVNGEIVIEEPLVDKICERTRGNYVAFAAEADTLQKLKKAGFKHGPEYVARFFSKDSRPGTPMNHLLMS